MLVFDTSTIVLLAKSELLDLLFENFNAELLVSAAVENEISKKGNFDTMFIKKRIDEGKISVKEAGKEDMLRIMNDFNISIGEAEAIAIALKNKKATVATDDKGAINACKVLRIPFVTAIAFLIRAKEKKLLSTEKALGKLEILAKYGRYSKRILHDSRQKLEGG